MKPAMYLAIVFVVLNFVTVLPFPQFDDEGREILPVRDRIYYGFPLFWYRRPFHDNDGEIVSGGQVEWKRRPSKVSYTNVGSGWGR